MDARGDDALRLQRAQLGDLEHAGNGAPGRRGHHRAEVARGLAVGQVAPAVTALGLDERQVAMDGVLQHVGATVDDAGFLGAAVGVDGQFGAEAGGCEEGADAGTGGAQPFGQVALGHQLQLDLAAAVQAVEHVAVGLARKAADDLAHAPGLEQRGQAVVAVAGVVVDHGELARTLLDQAVDEFVGDAGGAEAADEHGGTVFDATQGVGDTR